MTPSKLIVYISPFMVFTLLTLITINTLVQSHPAGWKPKGSAGKRLSKGNAVKITTVEPSSENKTMATTTAKPKLKSPTTTRKPTTTTRKPMTTKKSVSKGTRAPGTAPNGKPWPEMTNDTKENMKRCTPLCKDTERSWHCGARGVKHVIFDSKCMGECQGYTIMNKGFCILKIENGTLVNIYKDN